ncbi:MAG: ATP-binding protein [Desulfovibrionaceae bacterium]
MKFAPPRLGITAKLSLWCLALLLVFYGTTALLFTRINRMVADSSELAGTHYDVGVATQRLLQRLQSLEENLKRYELLGRDIYVEYVVQDLKEFSGLLSEVLGEHPELRDRLAPLTREFTITMGNATDPERLFAPNETVAAWRAVLQAVRDDNQADMRRRLRSLHGQAREASRLGFVGLVAGLSLGLFGTLFIAWRLRRQLRELERGMAERAGGGRPSRPVRVLTRDELGELARAFNDMTARLEREERLRADFIAMLSHEIRTPLTSIRESVELVGDGAFGAVNDRQRRFLDISRQEIGRLTRLLERLMQVTRLEAGPPELIPRPCPAADLARSALERVAPAAEARGVRLEPDLPAQAPLVLADPEPVQQVLLNLLGNAVKFSPEGGAVRLGLTPEPGAGRKAGPGRAVFCVSDQGPGVPEAERDLVFDKYYRARGVRDSVDGAGLGLTIARGIVRAHGGEMWIEDAPGGGGRFCFSLPLAPAGAAPGGDSAA